MQYSLKHAPLTERVFVWYTDNETPEGVVIAKDDAVMIRIQKLLRVKREPLWVYIGPRGMGIVLS